MGFKLNRGYVLEFQGSALEGAEVHIKNTPIGVVLELLSDEITTARQIDLLVEYVTSWNFETADGEPIPVTSDGIKAHVEEAVIAKVLLEWFRAARGVTAPLDLPSNDGERSQAPPIPMETLSPDQPS